jgi:hypothetical protein
VEWEKMSRFEIGKSYGNVECGFDPITVIKRTAKMILVDMYGNQWRMKIRVDSNGDEWVVDSYLPRRYYEVGAYSSKYVV